MTTNLLFAFPDIPFNSEAHTLPNKDAAAGYDKSSVIYGSRSQRFLFDTSSNLPSHLFDMGAGYNSLDSSAEYLIVSYANLTINSGSTAVIVEARTGVAGPFTGIINDSWVITDLLDPNRRDYITTFAATAKYRQWQVSLHGSSNTAQFPHAQIYLGTFLDIGRDPSWSRQLNSELHQDKGMYERKRIEFNYEGITTTKRQEFENKIGQYKDSHPIFLYSQTYSPVLLGNQLLNVAIQDYSFRAKHAQQNDLTLIVEEVY